MLMRVRLRNTWGGKKREMTRKDVWMDGCKMTQGKLVSCGDIRDYKQHRDKHRGHGMIRLGDTFKVFYTRTQQLSVLPLQTDTIPQTSSCSLEI